MLNIYNKILLKTSACILMLISFVLIINSCKKDLKGDDNANLTTTVALAKTWYEQAYPSNAGGSLTTQAITNGRLNFSKLIKPDWEQAVSYKRLNKDVIETASGII